MTSEHLEILRRESHELLPVATDVEPRMQRLSGIQAVLFDIYGTLFISGSGDVGSASDSTQDTAFAAAIRQAGWRLTNPIENGPQLLRETIVEQHQKLRSEGIEFPEIEIDKIWQQTIEGLQTNGQLDSGPNRPNFRRLALLYEVQTNPVWPMPGLKDCLEQLCERQLKLGIVSNAQFFTPLLFEAFLQQSREQLGFTAEFEFYSFLHSQAKPGKYLYQAARESLEQVSIAPHEVLFVGNDLLNDIATAGQVGFRTALFAGDRRSLRIRAGDPRVEGVQADLVITCLAQLAECV